MIRFLTKFLRLPAVGSFATALITTAFFSVLLFSATAIAAELQSLSSPNGALTVQFRFAEKSEPYPTGKRFYYSVYKNDQKILLDSPIGFDFVDQAPLATNWKLQSQQFASAQTHWQRIWGKSKKVTDHYSATTLLLQETDRPKRKLLLHFRAYDDGIAFRYEFPQQTHLQNFELAGERSYFVFPDNHTVWATSWPSLVGSQEEHFTQQTLAALNNAPVVGTPLLIKSAHDTWIALYEAALEDWAGMTLIANSSIPNSVVTRLSPLPTNLDIAVKEGSLRYSPWRVIAIGNSAGELITSNLMHNLNKPNQIADTSWIVPGKSAWDWWWSGSYGPDVDFKLGSNTATMKYFIDLAADMGWEYQLVDWQWYGEPFIKTPASDWTPNPNVDITKQTEHIDIQELVAYAAGKNVKLLLWLEWHHADKQLEEAFALYESWGIAGVKIDFMNRVDQEMVNYYHRVIHTAARHKLLVNFHGAYMPTGIDRTWPNFITREGVLGNEYNKWSDKVTPEHCVTIPFTRMLGGHMDFTPGGFLNVMPENFEIRSGPAPQVMGTRSFQLAMFVVYESALTVVADSPYNYRNQPGIEFLKQVPTSWDESLVIHGEVGDYITMARRRGNTWYLGSMTDNTARELLIPLDFLGKGKYEATIFADPGNAEEKPQGVNISRIKVSKKDVLQAKLARAGGQAVILQPL